MRTCSTCGASNPAEARFCQQCGSALAETCPRCGAELPPGSQFCPTCGARIAPAPEPREERKLVTVLFADVSGSTSLGERLDPEQFKEVLRIYFDVARSEIEAQGGTVEKYIGDAVVGAFGVPRAHEDDPDRALRAALRMRRSLEEANRTSLQARGVALAIKIGVHTGEVVAVEEPVPGEAMVTGDTTNVASRLEQAAEPTHILVSERTARASRGFHFVEVGPLSLKGKEQLVHVYELLGEVEPIDDWGRHRFGAPMVGRESENAVLQSIFQRVAAESRPHLVTVYGEAGVGKSRLVREFVEWSRRLDDPPMIARGRCLPYGEGVTYWPLAEILKQHAGVLDSDPPDVAVQKVADVGADFLSGDISADPEAAVAALCFSVGLEPPGRPFAAMDPRQIRTETSAAWRAYFSSLARQSPTIVEIEDIHWADPALLELLDELAERAQGPLLFVCSARPELSTRSPGWGGGRWNFSSLFLEPLTPEESDRLVNFLVSSETLPVAVRDRILERAGGNPFFLEEIVQHLIDDGRLVASADGWRAAEEGAVIEIPDTVQGVLAARMDLLGKVEKRVLQSAAVVGRVFWTGAVGRLLSVEPAQLDAALRDVEDRGLVLARLSSSVGGQSEYMFKHILTRDVAYQSLPKRQRAYAHERVMAWIEETTGERQREFVELLAYHSAQAYEGVRSHADLDPDQTEAVRRKAFRYGVQASEEARSKLVLDKAQRLAEQALGIATTPLERSWALEALGQAYLHDYQGDLAWKCLREAVDARLAQPDGDRRAVARLCASALGVATRGRGLMRSRLSLEEVAPYLGIGFSHLDEGVSEERVRLLTVQSFWPFSFRDSVGADEEIQRAMRAGEEAADLALRLGRPDLASAALDGVGSCLISRSLYGEAVRVVERRLELVGALADPWEVGDIYAVAAWSAFHLGRYRHAFEFADEGFRRAAPNTVVMALYCLDWRALARCRLGEWDGFFEDVALAGEMLGDRRMNPPGYAADHIAAAAFVHEARGETDLADQAVEVLSWVQRAEERPNPAWAVWPALLLARRGLVSEALATLERPQPGPFDYGRGYVMEARCDVLAEGERWEEAREVVAEARRHAAEAGLLALPFFADRLEGLAAVAGGDAERGLSLLRRARTGFDGLEARWETARTTLALGRALSEAGRPIEARAETRAALPVFERLRSVRELAQAEAMLARTG